ncbi:MAG TPA: glycoside hydrolase family 3 N-terminal domain-containing protein [Lapillicoccus sp.]|nr:glycoside hydrolase family 3 N-terminal domain-containing protein [Lapillicoccus sp.]
MPRRPAFVAFALAGLGALAACSADPAPSGGGSTTAPLSNTTITPSPTSTTTPPSCAEALAAALTLEQKVGQLLMVGAQAGTAPAALDPVLTDQKAGGVVLLGTWNSAPTVSGATQHWQPIGRTVSGGVGLLVSADQEGGQVRHLQGTGFASTPSALSQGRAGTAGPNATTVAANLKAVGVNVNLAPVADTVAASFARQNGPIGVYQREYGNDPATVTRSVTAAVSALQAGGVSATVKHFPGLGRVTGNTDLTANGTTDTTTTADDAYLEPFRAGIQAGVDLVMISSATYSQIDPDNRAPFSSRVVTGLLREQLRYDGVVVSDDLGGAVAVASVPPGERATRFVAAGGDIVLTGLPATAPTMAGALRDKAQAEPAFAAQVDAAATRVLELKVRRGLASC